MRARSAPSQWSPMITTARLMRPAAPQPCRKRRASSDSNVGANAARPPLSPNTVRHGTTTDRRPYRSASTPITGARRMPGAVAAPRIRPTAALPRPKSFAMSGATGVTSTFARIPVSVMLRMTANGGRLGAPAGASSTGRRQGARGTFRPQSHFPERLRTGRPSGSLRTVAGGGNPGKTEDESVETTRFSHGTSTRTPPACRAGTTARCSGTRRR
jgi:hypothetical protein